MPVIGDGDGQISKHVFIDTSIGKRDDLESWWSDQLVFGKVP